MAVPLFAAAAAAVAAVAVAGVLLAGNGSQHCTATAGGAVPAPLTWHFSIGHVPGYRIVRTVIARPSYPADDVTESADVNGTGRRLARGTLSYDSADPKMVAAGTSFVLHGVRYYYRVGRHVTAR